MSRASSSPGRKEEFPLASDLQECRVCGRASLLFFGRLSVTSCLLFLFFLCCFACLPSNPFSLDSAQPLQRNQELIGLPDYRPLVCYSSPIFPQIVLLKCPKVAGVSPFRFASVLAPCPASPTKEIWIHTFSLLWCRCHFPAWARSILGWDRCRERNCCWKWVCEAGTEKGAAGYQMASSGRPYLGLGAAEQQKAETGTLAGIQSCRKACQHAAPPEETKGDHVTQCSLLSSVERAIVGHREERRGSGAGYLKGIGYATPAVCVGPTDKTNHSNTRRSTRSRAHTHTCGSVVLVPVSGS